MNVIVRVMLVAVLACGLGCARSDWIDRTLVTVDVTGTWEGSLSAASTNYSPPFTFNLEQQGPQVSGSVRRMGVGTHAGTGPIKGTVAGDVFSFRMANGTLSGEMTVNGDEMTGQITGPPSGALTLRRVK